MRLFNDCFPVAAVVLSLVTLVACSDPAATLSTQASVDTQPVSLKIAGSSTVLPVVTKAADAFKKIHPEVDITVNAGGSGVGVTYASQNLVDIGMASRHITEEEHAKFPGIDIKIHTIAKDAVACVVSSEVYDSGIQSLDKDTIARIFSGDIQRWSEIGGPDREILVVDKEHHRGTRHVFMDYVMGDENARAPGADIVTGSNNEQQSKLVSSDSGIGMLSFAWINEDVKGVSIKVGDSRVEPSIGSIRDGSYPIYRDLNLITVGDPKGVTKQFIDFIASDEGKKIVEESGYVPAI